MGKHNALLISPQGLDAEGQNTLKTALSMLATDGIHYQLHSQNMQSAHLVVIDDDNDNGRSLLQQARDGQVKLVFSTTPRTGKNLVSVKKPINLTLLKDILGKVFHKMQAQLAQRNTAEQTHSKQVSSDLFKYLLQSKEQQQILKISCASHADVFSNGATKSFATSADTNTLKSILKNPEIEINCEQISQNDFERHSNGLVISALFRLLWTAGVYGSAGNMLAGHSLDTPVKLRAWPNFTRNDFLPQHLKIAAVLARQPTSLGELKQQTQISESEIINFYNAAYAVDLIEVNVQAPVQTGQVQVIRKPDAKRAGILSKLAAHLKLGA